MGGAVRKPGQEPTFHLNIPKGRCRESFPSNTQKASLRSLLKRLQGKEKNTKQNDQQPHCESSANQQIASEYISPQSGDGLRAIAHPDSNKIMPESTSKNQTTEETTNHVETSSSQRNIFSSAQETTSRLDECPLNDVELKNCNSNRDFIQPKELNTQRGISTEILPECSSYSPVEGSYSDHNILVPLNTSNVMLQPQNEAFDVLEFFPSPHSITKNNCNKRSNSALNAVTANSFPSSAYQRPAHVMKSKVNSKGLPQSMSFNDFETSSNRRINLKRSLKLPIKSVSFNLANANFSGRVPPKGSRKPIGVASAGELRRRNSLPGAYQPRPLKSCLKALPKRHSVDTIPEMPFRLKNAPLNNREAEEWVGYYRQYLESMKMLPKWIHPKLYGSETNPNNDPLGGVGYHGALQAPIVHDYVARGYPEQLYKSRWHKKFRTPSNLSTRLPAWLSHSNAKALSSRNGLTNVRRNDSTSSNTSSSKPTVTGSVLSRASSRSSVRSNSSKRPGRNQKPENLPPEGTSIVVEMDENGFMIRRPEGQRAVDVFSVGNNWRTLKSGPTNVMDAIMRHKVDWDKNYKVRKHAKKERQHELSGKEHRKEHRGHCDNREDLKEPRDSRKKRHKEAHKDAQGDDHKEHRVRYRHVRRESHKGHGVRISHQESHNDDPRIHKSVGEDHLDGYKKCCEEYVNDPKKSHGVSYRKCYKEDHKDSYRKCQRGTLSNEQSEGHYMRPRYDNQVDFREVQKDRHRDRHTESHGDEKKNSHNRHREREGWGHREKERSARPRGDKTFGHSGYAREEAVPSNLHKVRRHTEDIPKKSKEKEGNSESGDMSDSSKTSAGDTTKESRNKTRNNRKGCRISRKKNLRDD